MYILRWTYRNTIPEYDGKAGELMQHLPENAKAAYIKRASDSRYAGLRVYQMQSGTEVDVTHIFQNKSLVIH